MEGTGGINGAAFSSLLLKSELFLPKLGMLSCLVSCDHIPRRSMALFRARVVLDELIACMAPRSSHQLQRVV
jgi:hypothetical protein